MIIGVTGKLGCGKDTVAKILVDKYKFIHFSLSDILREDLKRQGKEITRENLMLLGKQLRDELGGGILAERIISKTMDGKNYVITSIGRVEELDVLKQSPNFYSVFVDASPSVRYNRVKARKREKEKAQSFKEFMKVEIKESKGKDNFRSLDALKKHSEIILGNNSTLDVLNNKISLIMKKVNKRPDWDTYFFNILDAVSMRSTCDRGKVGSIIVRNNSILSTGYAGSPPGLPHCDEVGHLMMKAWYEDEGEKHHCIRTTHAEQNAIAQAAKNGVSLDGATIYVNLQPCIHCTKLIISCGIKKVVARNKYQAGLTASKMLKQAGIPLIVLEDKIAKY